MPTLSVPFVSCGTHAVSSPPTTWLYIYETPLYVIPAPLATWLYIYEMPPYVISAWSVRTIWFFGSVRAIADDGMVESSGLSNAAGYPILSLLFIYVLFFLSCLVYVLYI
jgi:hypothetical protein